MPIGENRAATTQVTCGSLVMAVGHALTAILSIFSRSAVDVQPTGVQIDPCLMLTRKMCREKVPFHDPGLL